MNKQNTTIYKGMAILCIILSHVVGTFGRGRFTLFTPLGGIGVSIFLLLSAYGLNESWNELEEYNRGGAMVEKEIYFSLGTIHYSTVSGLLAISYI